MRRTKEAVITIWGDFACWTRPESKVERLSYPVPTPSGIRGVLASIYAKPNEFYWQVKKIEVHKLSPQRGEKQALLQQEQPPLRLHQH